jgi:catechol 2,3-dioxygenase-like lactoylglutathione lyase family enzyme
MIQKMTHASVYVLDQERAKEFYTDKLGFEVQMDAKMGDFRWLTVSPKGQKDFQLVLMPIAASPMMDEATAATIRALVEKGTFGGGVLETDDCQRTYDELRAKGVEFKSPPTERPYGIEAVFKDDSGNWFSLGQKPR